MSCASSLIYCLQTSAQNMFIYNNNYIYNCGVNLKLTKFIIIISAYISRYVHTAQQLRSILASSSPPYSTQSHLMDESFMLNTHLNMCNVLKGVTLTEKIFC